MRLSWKILLTSILATATFCAGLYLNPGLISDRLYFRFVYGTYGDEKLSEKLDEFIKLSIAIRSLYVDEKTAEELVDSAMKGMVSNLDPYSHLFIGSEVVATVENFRDQVYNNGVGMSIGLFGKTVQVVEVFDGYSAFRAGIKPGDTLVRVNGVSTSGATIERVINMVRGPEGTTVSVEVGENGSGKTRTLTLTREKVKVNSVLYKDLDDSIAYIKIRSFNQETVGEFFAALGIARTREGLVIDLRDNPGGDLDSVINMLGYLIGPDRVIMSVKGRIVNREYKTKNLPGIPLKIPAKVTVLINNSSASASEIMTGNLKHYKVAKIIGLRTFGKATMQNYLDVLRPNVLPDKNTNLLLGITVARYYLPDGSDISTTGVVPDIEVRQAGNFKGYDYITERDDQFQAALKLLRGN